MKRISALIVATAALAVGAAPAYAGLPGAPDVGGVTGGNATATGGNGGNANSGNVQVLNGNSVALGLGGKADADGGNTSAQSGDAYGGDGGNAKAKGGDADARNKAKVHQEGTSKRKHSASSDESSVVQGSPIAEGGEAEAIGGDGGFANTGNWQFGNGNAWSESWSEKDACSDASGGDTSAKSGDAYGGDGGDAKAIGGDADASNVVHVLQLGSPFKGGSL
jgi:hypothetical protein